MAMVPMLWRESEKKKAVQTGPPLMPGSKISQWTTACRLSSSPAARSAARVQDLADASRDANSRRNSASPSSVNRYRGGRGGAAQSLVVHPFDTSQPREAG